MTVIKLLQQSYETLKTSAQSFMAYPVYLCCRSVKIYNDMDRNAVGGFTPTKSQPA